MSESKKMHVGFSLTLNLGNCNSAKLGASIEENIDSIDDFDDVFDMLYKKLRKKVFEELSTLNTAFRKKVQ